MTRRTTATAALAVVVLLVGNLLAWLHESEVRHVTCAEHGEQLHAAESTAMSSRSDNVRWIAIEGPAGEHQDCTSARQLRTSTQITPGGLGCTLVIAAASVEATVLAPRSHAVDVIAIAPKTSPPT
jgi:hypothetical protein